jgi:hypothetical protein
MVSPSDLSRAARRAGAGQGDVAVWIAPRTIGRERELSQEGVKYGSAVQIGWGVISPGNRRSAPGKMTLKISRGNVLGKLCQCSIEPRKQKVVVWCVILKAG